MTMTFAAPTSLVIKPLGNLPIYPDPPMTVQCGMADLAVGTIITETLARWRCTAACGWEYISVA